MSENIAASVEANFMKVGHFFIHTDILPTPKDVIRAWLKYKRMKKAA